jgi:hypothetical protein
MMVMGLKPVPPEPDPDRVAFRLVQNDGLFAAWVLKGTLTRDFDLWFFSSINFPFAPDTRIKAFRIVTCTHCTALSMTPL